MPEPSFIEVNGVRLEASPMGALFWRERRALVVSDLHLEKGSFYARRGVLLPPYDTRTTIARLKTLCRQYEPSTVISLGDAFHDADSEQRMGEGDAAALAALVESRHWIWVLGNHDSQPPKRFAGETCAELTLGALIFRHEPQAAASRGELAGHLHPCARIVTEGRSFRRRCFVADGKRAVLPAFGAYAGGLNVLDVAFAGLFARPTAHVLGPTQVYALGRDALAPDRPMKAPLARGGADRA